MVNKVTENINEGIVRSRLCMKIEWSGKKLKEAQD